MVQEWQGVLQVCSADEVESLPTSSTSYLPGKLSPISVHNLRGINVEVSKSSMNYVTLSPLTLASTGRYRCEVSEEGPMLLESNLTE